MQRVKGLKEDEEEARRRRKKERADDSFSESYSVVPSGEEDSLTENSPHPTPLKTGLKPLTKVKPDNDKTKERRFSSPRAADMQRGMGSSQSLKSLKSPKIIEGDENPDLDKEPPHHGEEPRNEEEQ